MSGFTATVWPLLLLPVLGRLFGATSPAEAVWNTRRELGISVVIGSAYAALSALWLWRYHLRGGGLLAGELIGTCNSLLGNAPISITGMAIAQLTASIGIESALLWTAFLSQAILGMALYLWGRALHGRLAGVLTVLFALSVGPLVVLTRSLSFTPPTVAALALVGALVALAERLRQGFMVALAGLALALAPWLDARGWMWALPGFCLLIAVSLAERKTRWIAFLSVPMILSWGIASYLQPEALQQGAFIWGSAAAAAPKAEQALTDLLPLREQLSPYLLPGLLSLGISAIGLQRPWQIAALLLTLLPNVLVLQDIGEAPRYLPLSLMGIPLLMAVACAEYLNEPWIGWGRLGAFLDRRRAAYRKGAAWLGVALVVLLVLGIVPSWLSPVAHWRMPLRGMNDPQTDVAEQSRCVAALMADDAAGRVHLPYGPPHLKQQILQFPSETAVFQQAMSIFDQNRDGILSSIEYNNFGTDADFIVTDTNTDGQISLEEFTTWVKVTQPRPQDTPFMNAANFLLPVPEEEKNTAAEAPPAPIKATPVPIRNYGPRTNRRPILILSGIGLSLVAVAGAYRRWRK